MDALSLLNYADLYGIDFGRKSLITLADMAGSVQYENRAILEAVLNQIRHSKNA